MRRSLPKWATRRFKVTSTCSEFFKDLLCALAACCERAGMRRGQALANAEKAGKGEFGLAAAPLQLLTT